MRLIESIAGKFLDELKDFRRSLGVDVVFGAAIHEALLVLRHDLGQLLAHRLAETVTLGHRESGQGVRHPHDLFLINGDAVGFLEERLGERVHVLDGLAPVLARDVVGCEFHRSRTNQRHERDQVLERRRLNINRHAGGHATFKLEDADRFASPKHFVRHRIFERDVLDREVRILRVCELDRLADEGQRAQAEEIHLEQSKLFEISHWVLRRDIALSLAAGALKRHMLNERVARNHHSGRVRRRVSRDAFELFRLVD